MSYAASHAPAAVLKFTLDRGLLNELNPQWQAAVGTAGGVVAAGEDRGVARRCAVWSACCVLPVVTVNPSLPTLDALLDGVVPLVLFTMNWPPLTRASSNFPQSVVAAWADGTWITAVVTANAATAIQVRQRVLLLAQSCPFPIAHPLWLCAAYATRRLSAIRRPCPMADRK